MADFKVIGKVVIDDDGNLKVVGNKAKKSAKEIDKVGKSAANADRQLKGAAQASSNASKNFSKMSQGISGGLVPAYATLAAQLFALSAVFRALTEASDFRVLNEGMRAFAASTGTMVNSLAKNLQKATGFQIDFRNAAQQSQIMLAAGFGQEQMSRLAKAAKGASTALGRNFEDSLNRLVRGVTKAEPELLDELGIILRLEPATKKYALRLNKTAKDLTTFEKSQAVLNEVLEQAESKYGAVADAVPVNQFNQLIATFMDLKDSAMLAITPLAEALGGFFSNNIGSAIAALALFVTGITKSVIPSIEQMNESISNSMMGRMGAGAATAFGDMKSSFAGIGEGIQQTRTAKARLKGQAGELTSAAAGKSAGIQALQRGKNLSRQQAAGLNTSLKNAEAQYKKHGKIVTGIFAGEDIKRVRSFKKAMKQMQAETSIATKVMTGTLKVFTSTAKVLFFGMGTAFKGVMMGMVTVTKFAARGINRALSLIAFVGIITLVIDGVRSLGQNLDNVTKGIGKMISKIGEFFQNIADKVRDLPFIGGLLGGGLDLVGKGAEIAGGKVQEFGKSLEGVASKNRAIAKVKEDFKELSERAKSTADEVSAFFKSMELQEAKTGKGASLKQMEAMISSSGVDAIFKDYKDLLDASFAQGPGFAGAEDLVKLEESIFGKDGIIGKLATVDETFAKILKNKDTMSIDKIFEMILGRTGEAGATTAAFNTLNSSLDAFESKFSSIFNKSDPMEDLITQVGTLGETLDQTQQETVGAIYQRLFGDPAEGMSPEDMNKAIQEIFGSIKAIQNLRTTSSEGLLQTQADSARVGGRSDAASRFEKERIKNEEFRFNIMNQTATVREKELAYQQTATEANKKAMEDEKKKLEILQLQSQEYARSVSVVGRIQDTFSKGIEDMFVKIAEGSMTAKDAFKSLATLVLQEMAKIAAMKMAASVTGFLGFANGGIMPVRGMASGGYTSVGTKRFGTGGIATQPTIMVGEGRYNEAVVPLPDGRTIPVEMTGGGGGTNNVVINVDAGGNASSTGNAEQAQGLGMAIQAAVMETLQREKRPGGVLGGG